jgi:hypothetical protein
MTSVVRRRYAFLCPRGCSGNRGDRLDGRARLCGKNIRRNSAQPLDVLLEVVHVAADRLVDPVPFAAARREAGRGDLHRSGEARHAPSGSFDQRAGLCMDHRLYEFVLLLSVDHNGNDADAAGRLPTALHRRANLLDQRLLGISIGDLVLRIHSDSLPLPQIRRSSRIRHSLALATWFCEIRAIGELIAP